MATITTTFVEDQYDSSSAPKSTWTATITANDITASGTTFSIPAPTVKAKYTGSNKGYADAFIIMNISGASYSDYLWYKSS